MEIIPKDEIEDEKPDYQGLDPKNVLNALNNLKNNYRVVLTLHLIEGYDYEEISQILNYTNENVRTIISRAKKKLKQAILAENIEMKIYGG
jgi:RNA polymerase sigma-70 factor (ECF subfamily)